MTVINTNVKSLIAQESSRSIGLSQATSMERLSTGLRINSAKDDAAGLSISTRMESQVRGLQMAIRNANDGISLMQTAEGALQETTNSLQRMRELAVQASNGINNSADRTALDKEVQQLKQEIDRIAEKTQFNNINILDGSYKDKKIQIGDKANQVLNLSIDSAKTTNLGLGNGSEQNVVIGARIQDDDQDAERTGAIDTELTTGAAMLVINNTLISPIKKDTSGSDPDAATDPDINDVVIAINNAQTGVKASAFNEIVAKNKGTGQTDSSDMVITVTAIDSGLDLELTIGQTKNMNELVARINEVGSLGTVQAKINDQGKLVLFNNTGATIKVEDGSDAGDAYMGGSGFRSTAASFYGMLKLESLDGKPITIGTNWRSVDTMERTDEVRVLNTLGLQATEKMNTGTEPAVGPSVVGAAVADADITTKWANGELNINGVNIWRDGQVTDGSDNGDVYVVGTAGAIDDIGRAWIQKVNLINSFYDQTGVRAEKLMLEDGASYAFKLTSNNFAPIRIDTGDSTQSDNGAVTTGGDQAYGGYATTGLLEQNVGAADFDTNVGSYGASGSGSALSGLNILSQDSALASIQTIDNAIEKVSLMRADLGAKQNRLNSTVNNLTSVVTNTQASKSRILDTDYGVETTNLARAQIISQAATAMLAQANQSAQTVLSLLK